MAKDCSFDIVSQVDMQEVDNAFQQAKKELVSRYDLKDSGSSIALDKQAMTFTVNAPSEFVCGQVVDVLHTKLIKRGIDIKSLTWGKIIPAAGATVRQTASIVNGIEKDLASTISKDIKAQKFKAKVQIEGDKLRVTSASKDVLQEIIAFCREKDYGQPIQFNNYR